MQEASNNIIIYTSDDGSSSVALYERDGDVWMNQSDLAELFDTSVPNVSMHIKNLLKDGEILEESVVKEYLTTAADGKEYRVSFYSVQMIIAIGFRVRSKRGIQGLIYEYGYGIRTENYGIVCACKIPIHIVIITTIPYLCN